MHQSRLQNRPILGFLFAILKMVWPNVAPTINADKPTTGAPSVFALLDNQTNGPEKRAACTSGIRPAAKPTAVPMIGR